MLSITRETSCSTTILFILDKSVTFATTKSSSPKIRSNWFATFVWSKYRLKDHLNIHDKEEFCRTCEEGFTSKLSYNRHIMKLKLKSIIVLSVRQNSLQRETWRDTWKFNQPMKTKKNLCVIYVESHTIGKIIYSGINELSTTSFTKKLSYQESMMM